MIFLLILLFIIGAIIAALMVYSARRSKEIEQAFPPIGLFKTVNGAKVHYVDRPAKSGKPANQDDAPVVVFLHGASGNLRDPYYAFSRKLDRDVRQIFIDRPGHGWSERGSGSMHLPLAQARQIIAFLDELKIEKAIFVGHSWSGALALTLGVVFPHRVSGLLLNAPVSHPWPGGINWYYPIAAHPIWGWLFTRALTVPVGEKQIACATDKVFWPNEVPDYYERKVGGDLVLTPKRFQANAHDIAYLRPYLVAMHSRYHEIKAPVTIITGDKDQVILPWVHSAGLEKNIVQARRIDLKSTGHMPHHTHTDIYVREIKRLADLVGKEKPQAAAE